MTKRSVRVSPLLPWTVRRAIGDDEPMPIPPVVGRVKDVEVAGKSPKRILPRWSWRFPVAVGK
jgi:hypothetical protein